MPKTKKSIARKRPTLPTHFITIDGKTTKLTRTEYSLLTALTRHPGKTVTYAELHKEVFSSRPLKNTHHLRMYIHLLRCRIELNPAKPRYLLTVRKRGYCLTLALNHFLGELYLSAVTAASNLPCDAPRLLKKNGPISQYGPAALASLH